MKFSRVRDFTTAAVGASLVGLPAVAKADLDDIVFVKGASSDSPTAFAQLGGPEQEIDIAKACGVANQIIFMAAANAPPSVMQHLFGDDVSLFDIPMIDCSDAKPKDSNFVIMFSTCSMTMTDGKHTMRWIVPPDAPEAAMSIVNVETEEYVTGAWLETRMGQVTDVAKGRETSSNVTANLPSKTYELHLEIGPTGNYQYSTETFTGQGYSYDYSGKIVFPGMEATGMFSPTMNSDGSAWISADVPGADVVAAFYTNFRNHLAQEVGDGTLYSAMIEQMADMADKGIPLETQQTIKMEIFPGMSQGSTSTSELTAVSVWQGAASEHNVCGHLPVPEGYTQTTIEAMMSDAGGGASSEDMQDMSEAMAQYEAAMAGLSDEERQMLEQMGMGNMMQQATSGGANPAAAQAATAAGTGAAAARSGSAMPPSEELQGATVTESVQKHLQALGYEVGETDGELSLHTQIAISTFQAEKGLEVTGEVTPQLLGLLAAEVDSRR